MKVGIIILCRFNSSRLPGKILKEIDGKAILQHVIDQLDETVEKTHIVVATSDQSSDDQIADYCNENNINIYRGSLANVAERFLNAALKFEFDFAFRVNGDNLFINNPLISKMIELAQTGNYDFISNVPGRTWGYGMSLECVRTDFYKTIFIDFKTDHHFEHVTIYLYENETLGNRKYILNETYHNLKNQQLAIDTPEDFKKLSLLYQQLKHSNEKEKGMIPILNKILKQTES